MSFPQARLAPHGGATIGSVAPATALTWDGRTLTAADLATEESVRLAPVRLYHYGYERRLYEANGKERIEPVWGLAALDEDGLVLADIPGNWHDADLDLFARQAGLPIIDGRRQPTAVVRAMLAGRAPGWRRIRGEPPRRAARWRKPVGIGAGVVGGGIMVYLVANGMGSAWRGLSMFGRLIADFAEVKWLLLASSPLALVLRPLTGRLHRRRVRSGVVLGSPGGTQLVVKNRSLWGIRGKEAMLPIVIGRSHGLAARLQLYSYDDLSGIFVLDASGCPLLHLPGLWSPEYAHRFAERYGLELAVHRLSKQEYLGLVRGVRQAMP
ncbi:hypothetical protein ACIBHX_50150 [Nonomuraea sp. NPDC050536]|uniref:hypothetical protein n=1 Tax=Nonomuraea sp. NPDC050536 TaxID=3364366 RepID=UPI0037C77742